VRGMGTFWRLPSAKLLRNMYLRIHETRRCAVVRALSGLRLPEVVELGPLSCKTLVFEHAT
jgi:hypothetical protein